MQVVCVVAMLAGAFAAAAQTGDKSQGTEKSVTFDRVVAVVNRQAILLSDLEDEMQLSVLDPTTNVREKMNEQLALERLISRTLIQQQIRRGRFTGLSTEARGDCGAPARDSHGVAGMRSRRLQIGWRLEGIFEVA